MIIVELFSGTASFTKVCREREHKCFTVDNDSQFKPDLCIDIMKLTIDMIPEEFRHPDVVWASVPCQKFSVASIYRYWVNGKPKNEETLKAIALVKKTIQLIKELNPKFLVIENPRGMLRKQDFMQEFHRDTVAYCQYGHTVQKPTDLWNNLNHVFKPMCKPGASCHERAMRSSRGGVQGIIKNKTFNTQRSPVLRGIVPRELCLEIIKHCEEINENCS